jgi:hypothetical protein
MSAIRIRAQVLSLTSERPVEPAAEGGPKGKNIPHPGGIETSTPPHPPTGG